MDFIIPAKASSERVPNKNWREFADGLCLVELLIEKLIAAGVQTDQIHVSCERPDIAELVTYKWGVKVLPRDPALCDNNVALTTWIRAICDQVPGMGDIAWCQVCDPLFDEYAECLQQWREMNSARRQYDSLAVCRPWRGYLMTTDNQPIGWSFGEHHTPSQQLPRFHTMPFTFSILTRRAISQTGYHIGRRPLWYEATGPHVDIDTETDFEMAKQYYQTTRTQFT